MTAKFDGEIGELGDKVTEINRKIDKTFKEKHTLEDKKSDSSKQMISDKTYVLISEKVSRIASIMMPSATKGTERPAVDLLLDLERQIDKFVTYYQITQDVEMEREGIK